MANLYTKGGAGSTPVSGRYLSHNKYDAIGRAFLAADLYTGAKVLVKPTLKQSALLARVNATYAWWAVRREPERATIEAGSVPLVPAQHKPLLLGIDLDALAAKPNPDLVALVRSVGIDRVLEAACFVEASNTLKVAGLLPAAE